MKNDLVAVLYFDDTQVIGRIAKVSYGQNITPVEDFYLYIIPTIVFRMFCNSLRILCILTLM